MGIFCSELTAVAVALIAGLYIHVPWLAGFVMVPLVLKLLATIVAVKREHLRPILEKDIPTQEKIFEIDDLVRGFFIIKGSDEAVCICLNPCLNIMANSTHRFFNSSVTTLIRCGIPGGVRSFQSELHTYLSSTFPRDY